ncbi:GlsB/YeaQ/YmgE family stress response membrane protein [Azospirillum sp. Sh1]|uniref:GlsB/YeaQ/YmgE family stress response membrane protein n=1 Tax=Azospirillum sp. Sh1 TaxID=2607285 RepID=UPI0011EEB8B0|nr:GlsB/YeaQ/YmgE family stress response membrane protein [Azospirillum sp. Sh1]KAA0569889.1 GlsB/YeaQ/YmgE family stress response membrane protein [Azospirillum sp. Sh1]
MGIIAWIILGLIAGFIASKIVNKSGQGAVMDIVLGILGALVGGFLMSIIGGAGITGFNIWSILVAIFGAIVVLWIYHAVAGRRTVG